MVNQGDGEGRKRSNVRRVRAVFVDLDGAPVDPVRSAPLYPHIIIESSPGKFHAYWKVDGLPLDQFTAVQVALAHRFEGDPAVKDLPRVMRLPGFLHLKAEPFRTRILERRKDAPYSASEFLAAFGIDPSATPSAFVTDERIMEGARNTALFAAAVAFQGKGIPPEGVLTRIRSMNAKRCDPPLPESEIQAICEQARKYRPSNSPIGDILAIPELRRLSLKARWIYLLAYERSKHSEGPFSLTVRDCEGHGIRRRQRADALDELREAKLLECVRPYRGGMEGSPRTPGLYRLRGRIDP
jgi:hypothetical protein